MSSPYVLPRPRPDPCQKPPIYYCISESLRKTCDKTGICDRYPLESDCLKGPEVYCQSQELADSCGKSAYCLTWPDPDVTAVLLVPTQKSFVNHLAGDRF